MENRNSCPVCSNTKTTGYINCKDFTVSQKEFSLVKCSACNFIFTNPIPNETEIGNYYKSETYISHTNTNKGIINKIYHLVRGITLKNKVDLINQLSTKGKILDIGCGTGHFIKECKNQGWTIAGTEPDKDARTIAEQLTNLKIEESVLNQTEAQSYHIITMWHVVEHIHRLNETLDKVKTLLKDNGHLIIAVPNCESYDAKHYKEFWAAYDVPRHLYHFTQETMEKFLHKHGFKISKKRPMKYDSFYVSMMSEKYKKGNILNALITGLISNIKGINKLNYSSIIYVAEKIK